MPSAEPTAPEGAALEYHRLHRLGRSGWSWVLIGTPVVVFLVFAAAQALYLPVALVAVLFGATVATDPVTPAGLAWLNLAWAAAIPLACVVQRLVNGIAPRWLVSVAGRVRWRWLGVSLGLAAVALLATLAVASLLPQQGGTEIGGAVNEMTRRSVGFLLVILLLTPLQAAGEEYVFRGYLTQAFGGAIAGRIGTAAAIVVPAVLFALAHGSQDLPVFVDRLAFGLVAGTLVVLTGGLEAAIAMHMLNNWLALGLALVFGNLNAALHPASSTWWTLPTTLTQSLVFLALTVWVGRRTGLGMRTGEGVLEPPQGPV